MTSTGNRESVNYTLRSGAVVNAFRIAERFSIIMSWSNLERLLLVFLRCLLFLQVPADTTTAPTVNLGYAQYQGAVDIVTNTTSFLGIRYAAAPVGTPNEIG